MSRRYLALCTDCDWHTGLLEAEADAGRAFRAHTCAVPPPPKPKKRKPEQVEPAAPIAPPALVPPITHVMPAVPHVPVRTSLDELGDPDADWRTSALCSQIDGELFFPDKGGSPKSAKKVCARCPVSEPCLDLGLSTGDQFGIYGGLSYRQRIKHPRYYRATQDDRSNAS